MALASSVLQDGARNPKDGFSPMSNRRIVKLTRTLRQLVLLSSMVSAIACRVDTAEQQEQQKQQKRVQVPAAPKNTVPVVAVALDQTYPSNNGLLKTLDGNGSPVRDGA